MVDSSPARLQLDAAHRALAKGEYPQAHALAMQVLQDDPAVADAYFIMAMIARAHGNTRKALTVIERAVRFAPDNQDHRLFQAQCLLDLNQHGDVHQLLCTLGGDQLHTAHQHDTAGVLHSHLGQHTEALPYFNRACALAPTSASYRYNLATSWQFTGDIKAAETAYEAAIALDPNHYRSHFSLSQLHRQSAAANHLPRLHAIWADLDETADARLHIGHALAKEYEDLGDYANAIHYLGLAKTAKREQLAGETVVDSELFAALATLPKSIASRTVTGHDSREPIFIVGLPRTGTTLIERILSSHSQVQSAGELGNFSLLVKRQLPSASPWVLDSATIRRAGELDYHRLGEDYLQSTRHLTGHQPHFIDKMPLNFMYLPLIAAALPGAKLICLRRNPMDTCLSNYRQLFATGMGYYNYSYSLGHTADFYAAFDRLMAGYQDALGERLYQVEYEAVVRGPETEIRALLQFCELDWEPDCVEFQNNSAPVATASSTQVREKIYHRAVDRWRHYQPWLQELTNALERNEIHWQSR